VGWQPSDTFEAAIACCVEGTSVPNESPSFLPVFHVSLLSQLGPFVHIIFALVVPHTLKTVTPTDYLRKNFPACHPAYAEAAAGLLAKRPSIPANLFLLNSDAAVCAVGSLVVGLPAVDPPHSCPLREHMPPHVCTTAHSRRDRARLQLAPPTVIPRLQDALHRAVSPTLQDGKLASVRLQVEAGRLLLKHHVRSAEAARRVLGLQWSKQKVSRARRAALAYEKDPVGFGKVSDEGCHEGCGGTRAQCTPRQTGGGRARGAAVP